MRQKTTGVPILVCTDLASRGLDLPNCQHCGQLRLLVMSSRISTEWAVADVLESRPGEALYFSVERELVEVVREAEMQQRSMVLEGEVVESEEDEDDQAGEVKKPLVKRGVSQRN
jgi:superfamily II DNA/RNA helicase